MARRQDTLLQQLVDSQKETIEELRGVIRELRGAIEQLKAESAARETRLEQEIEKLRRRFLKPKTEKMPSADRKVRPKEKPNGPRSQQARRKNREEKAKQPTERVDHPVADEDRVCPCCGGSKLSPLGEGKTTVEYEYIPGRFVRREHVQEVLACQCGEGIVAAPAPQRVFDRCQYGPGFIAHLVTAKCADALPLHRLEKQYERIGVPVMRSTMTDLFHRAAELLAPLAERILERVSHMPVVQADETSIKVQNRDKRAFVWTFLGEDLIGYRFSGDRSGKTPAELLGGTTGVLVVDGYTGYDRVIAPEGRTRAGCIAHMRRKFFEALDTAPRAQEVLDLILDVYRVEHEAKEKRIVGTKRHLALRQRKAKPTMSKLHAWLIDQRGHHPPRSVMGQAIGYALNNWEAMICFLDNPKVPVDNNASERALRAIALGRKNYLFVGNEEAGKRVATLYSLVASCILNGVNPQAYLADVLLRVQSHPHADIDAILPNAWQPAA